MGLNTRRLDRTKQESANTGGGGGFLRLHDGRNILRLFTFNHVVDKTDFTRGIYKKGEVKVGDDYDEIERSVPRHFTEDGVVNCFISNCEYCRKAQELLNSDDEDDKKLGKKLKATIAYYVNVVDVENEDAGVQICSFPPSVFNEILTYILDPEYGEDIMGCEGRDFIIDRDSKQTPSKMYKVKLRDEKRCEGLEESLQDGVQDLFQNKAFEAGWSAGGDSEDEEVPPKKRKPKKSEPEEDNEFEDEEETTDETEDVLPWEDLPKWCAKGSPVKFEDDDGNVLQGELVEIDQDGDLFDVDVDGDIWSLKFKELSPVAKKKKVKKAVKKVKKSKKK